MQIITPECSNKIRNMGFLCAMLVVVIHTGWRLDDDCAFNSFVAFWIRGCLANIAVPFFFTISGFFFAAHIGEENYWRTEISKRLKSWIAPYIFWSIIALVITMPLALVADILGHRPIGAGVGIDLDYFLISAGIRMDTPPRVVTLWYIRSLFILVLFSPIWACLRRKASVITVICLWISWLWVSAHPLPMAADGWSWFGFFRFGFSLMGGAYFFLGMILNRYFLCNRIEWWLALLCVAIGVALYLIGQKVHGVISIAGIGVPFLLFGLWRFVPSEGLPAVLTRNTFALFVMHPIVLTFTGLLFKVVRLPAALSPLLSVVVSLVVSVLVGEALHLKFPKAASMLFGGR